MADVCGRAAWFRLLIFGLNKFFRIRNHRHHRLAEDAGVSEVSGVQERRRVKGKKLLLEGIAHSCQTGGLSRGPILPR